jgi:hypothetical protein
MPQFCCAQRDGKPIPPNSHDPPSLDCTYIQPLSNIQGGHVPFLLATERIITCRAITVTSRPSSVNTTVNDMVAGKS